MLLKMFPIGHLNTGYVVFKDGFHLHENLSILVTTINPVSTCGQAAGFEAALETFTQSGGIS